MELSERMRTPIDGPLIEPIMTISQIWYDARVDEVAQLEAERDALMRLLCIARDYLEQHWDMESAPLNEIVEATRKETQDA